MAKEETEKLEEAESISSPYLQDLEAITEEQLRFSALNDGLGLYPNPPRIPKPTVVAATTPYPFTRKKREEPLKFAVLFDRLSAFCIDLSIVNGMLFFVFYINAPRAGWNFFVHNPVLCLLYALAVHIGYFLLGEGVGGQTLGKMFLRLTVVEDGPGYKPISFAIASKRMACFFLSFLAVGAGPMSALWDSRRRPWHDRVTTSLVHKE